MEPPGRCGRPLHQGELQTEIRQEALPDVPLKIGTVTSCKHTKADSFDEPYYNVSLKLIPQSSANRQIAISHLPQKLPQTETSGMACYLLDVLASKGNRSILLLLIVLFRE